MNKTKTLRFYLTEICDEFHKEKDCYYRLKFAKETVGIFNSLTDVFLKIESLKTPVRLWVLRGNKFGSVISFPLAINFRSLNQAQREEFLAKTFSDFDNSASQTSEKTKKSDKNLKNPLKNSENQKQATELIIPEDEKTIDEILYAIKQNGADQKIECAICQKDNETEALSHQCPCHLVELEILEDSLENKIPELVSENEKILLDSASFPQQGKKADENLELENLENPSDAYDFFESFNPENPDLIKQDQDFQLEEKLENQDDNLIFNQQISDQFDEKILENVSSTSEVLILKGQEKEFEVGIEKKVEKKVLDHKEYGIINSPDLEVAGEKEADIAYQHSEFCDSVSSFSSFKTSCSACSHNATCPWCQKYRTYLLEAKNCPACILKFKEQNFDLDTKLLELRSSNLVSKKENLVKKESQICKACSHNALCSWCQRYRTYLLEARNCPKCLEIFKFKNIDINRKIFELSHPSYPYILLKNPYLSNCYACNHNATCPWCQKYRTYLLEARNCPACLEKFKAKNFNVDAKLLELRYGSYTKHLENLGSKISCQACNHNANCLWCQRYATYLLEAKNCPTCLERFRLQNFDIEKKLSELRVNDYQNLYSLIWKQTYNSPCPTCNHNFFCPKCSKLRAFYKEARKCLACQELLKQRNINIEEKIYQLSYYPYFDSRALVRYQFGQGHKLPYNENCASCVHVYFCKFCLKYRAFLLEAKNCPACRYLFAKRNLSIDYLLKIINYEVHDDNFHHISPLLVLAHGKKIVHEEIPQIVEIVLDYSWIKIYPQFLALGNYPLNKFPAIIPLFQGIVYQALLDQNWDEHNAMVDEELFNTKRGFGGYNLQGGLSVGLGDLSVDEATRVIAASTSSVDEDEEIIIVATEKSTIWGLPSYVLWFVLFAVIAVLLVVVIMFVLYGAGII
ncbi:hypothetical protein [Mesomycoplasma hyopneumoniae]|uniref:hypothetical protein n=1 Tax=Mesomycoplasma hyopneumoniae TaxID=2099 RepID=UPI00136BF0BD|nr:hypothetical protein [Mesomycoplasma hyopneumoniae]MXR35030.1 hypothetical protein [Mesomycoplasma hyopneumoniae]